MIDDGREMIHQSAASGTWSQKPMSNNVCVLLTLLYLISSGCGGSPETNYAQIIDWTATLDNLNVYQRGDQTYYVEHTCAAETVTVRVMRHSRDSLTVSEMWGECDAVVELPDDVILGETSLKALTGFMVDQSLGGVFTMTAFDQVDMIVYPNAGGRLFHVAYDIESDDVWYPVVEEGVDLGGQWHLSLHD